MDEGFDPLRRVLLVRMLAAGAFAAAGFGCAQVVGTRPRQMPEGQSIYRIENGARVNGEVASESTLINPGDEVETGEGGLVFVVGDAAFYARPRSRILIGERRDGRRLEGLTLRQGGVLSVFGGGAYRVETPHAVVGIRGTGLYAQIEDQQDYVCTCYGSVLIEARADARSREEIVSEHHDAPRFVLAGGASGTLVRPAPFKDHTDEELSLLEALVGREPPFSVIGSGYSVPRRSTY
ncbi:MAG: hypothetical protein EA417_20100 [Gammaproteobacteria bacterium]|nr:MAG: hypothetical protein EA417_20100 [Gammaproteobacteria bacterium]